MGYTTDFIGNFELDKPLTKDQFRYLVAFSDTRRMRRDPSIAREFKDKRRKAVNLPIGNEGEFYVGDQSNFGQAHDASVQNYNSPPYTQPGLWCQWVPTDDMQGIEWNGAEKFYSYVEWLTYLIDNFLEPWGYKVSGTVRWEGEDRNDTGIIEVEDNVVHTYPLESYYMKENKRVEVTASQQGPTQEELLERILTAVETGITNNKVARRKETLELIRAILLSK